jgi:hypothetical protein
MKIKILLIAFLFVCSKSFSQGGVNIKFVPIDSIDARYIGQKIKIDFRPAQLYGSRFHKLSPRHDTIRITINDKKIDLIEAHGIGADYWYFEKEYLKSYNYQNGKILIIRDMEIKEINADSILTRMTLLLTENEKEKDTEKELGTVEIWIEKNKIDGIITRKH